MKYDWDKLFKRKKFTIVRGRDFHCQMHSMAQQVRNAAVAREKHVSVNINEDVITVTIRK